MQQCKGRVPGLQEGPGPAQLGRSSVKTIAARGNKKGNKKAGRGGAEGLGSYSGGNQGGPCDDGKESAVGAEQQSSRCRALEDEQAWLGGGEMGGGVPARRKPTMPGVSLGLWNSDMTSSVYTPVVSLAGDPRGLLCGQGI